MGLFESRLYCPALWFVVLIIPMYSSGCRTSAQPFTISGPGWRVQEGQALWRPREQFPELGGDLVMAGNEDGRSVVQFAKTPLPLVLAQTTRTNWYIEFPTQRMNFAGRGPSPTRFTWLYLHAALSGEAIPACLRFERKQDGGWRLENTRSGETLEGFLTP
jgi:hypothetical protein